MSSLIFGEPTLAKKPKPKPSPMPGPKKPCKRSAARDGIATPEPTLEVVVRRDGASHDPAPPRPARRLL